jgi:hypothetical protein
MRVAAMPGMCAWQGPFPEASRLVTPLRSAPSYACASVLCQSTASSRQVPYRRVGTPHAAAASQGGAGRRTLPPVSSCAPRKRCSSNQRESPPEFCARAGRAGHSRSMPRGCGVQLVTSSLCRSRGSGTCQTYSTQKRITKESWLDRALLRKSVNDASLFAEAGRLQESCDQGVDQK